MTKFEDLLDRLDSPRKIAGAYMSRCPAHEDSTPSLRISQGEQGVLLYCYAGCENVDVIGALGIEWSDLFDAEQRRDEPVLVASYTYQRGDSSTHMTVERWSLPFGKKTFRQRGSDGEYGLKGTKPCLYNLPAILAETDTIWIAEGEKDAETLTGLGASATTAPMGAGKWQPYYWRWLSHAKHVRVVADNDEPGRAHAAQIETDLKSHGIDVECLRPKWGKDATDHVVAGYGLADFVPFNPNQFRPLGTRAGDLMRKHFPPITWTIPGILGPGLALLGGPPKQGKSWMALDIALGVAFGGRALSQLQTTQGDVLYLSLDNDSERRLQQRAQRLLEARSIDCPVEFHVEWPTGADALKACREWCNEVRTPRLIVIDTFVKVEPDFDGSPQGQTAYGHSTDVLSRWAKLANDADLTVLAVHHDRKMSFADGGDADWINRFTGSRGITASAATLLFLDAVRGKTEGTLRLTGRDVGDFDIPLLLSRPFWTATDMPPEALEACGGHRMHLVPHPQPQVEGEGLEVPDWLPEPLI